MANTPPSHVEDKPRVPVEVCMLVIGAVYDNCPYRVRSSLATLSRCALVCRAWRRPAQQVLFDYAVVKDKDSLYDFAEFLHGSPELGSYVRRLELRGYLHVPCSPAALFPSMLRARLPNLSTLHILEFNDTEKTANALPDGVKELPTLPIHRYLSSLFTSISHISTLHLCRTAFSSFGDFARILHTLTNLQSLSCVQVSWAVLGNEPQCMAKRRTYDSHSMFLPKLRTLLCVDMDSRGTQRLLNALGSSLRHLAVKFPNQPPPKRVELPVVEEEDPTVALDLQSLLHLDRLRLYLAPLPQPHDNTAAALRNTLDSWVNSDKSHGHRDLKLYLLPYQRDRFKREDFVDLLRTTIGPAVETALCSKEPLGDRRHGTSSEEETANQTDPCAATLVVQNLTDGVGWVEWWRTRMHECFPTFARSRRLHVDPWHVYFDRNARWLDHERSSRSQPLEVPSIAQPSVTDEGSTNATESQDHFVAKMLAWTRLPSHHHTLRTLVATGLDYVRYRYH